jgi:hypothetical protein
MNEPDVYLIWSNEYGRWWHSGGLGYERSLSKAGRYTRQAALDICTKAMPGIQPGRGRSPICRCVSPTSRQ